MGKEGSVPLSISVGGRKWQDKMEGGGHKKAKGKGRKEKEDTTKKSQGHKGKRQEKRKKRKIEGAGRWHKAGGRKVGQRQVVGVRVVEKGRKLPKTKQRLSHHEQRGEEREAGRGRGWGRREEGDPNHPTPPHTPCP